MESKLLYDLHTHTRYSHGKGTILDNAKQADWLGLTKLGIADHGPGHAMYGIDMDAYKFMREDIDSARKLYPNMEILLGVEANIVNTDGSLDLTAEEQKKFDFIIAGFHYGYFGKNPVRAMGVTFNGYIYELTGAKFKIIRNRNTDLIVAALYNNDIKILSHPGAKADFDIDEIAKACAATNTLMEINNKHGALTVDGIRQAAKYDVQFIIGSDAHQSFHVGSCDKALERAQEAGLDLSRIVNLR